MTSTPTASPGKRGKPLAEALLVFFAFAIFTTLGIVCWFGAYLFWPYGIYFTTHTAWAFWVLAALAPVVPVVLRMLRDRLDLNLHGVQPVLVLATVYIVKSAAVAIPAAAQVPPQDEAAFPPAEMAAPEDASRFDFAFAGDIHTPNEHTRALIEQAVGIHEESPLAGFFLLGDNMPEEPFEETIPWSFEEPFAPLLDRGVPFYGVLGNHDYSGDLVEDQINYPLFNMEGRRWYSRTFGDGLVTFFILDTEAIIETPEQLFWLRDRLAADTSRWRIILTHKPLIFHEGQRGIRAPLSRHLARVIHENGGVDLFIAGHLHHYERFDYKGIKHLVVSASSELNRNPRNPNEEYIVRDTRQRAMGHLTVTHDRLDFRAFGEFNQTVDEFTVETPTRRSAAQYSMR